MFRLSPIIRLSLGLVMLTLSILVGADLFGLIPSRTDTIIQERWKICESLAVYFTVTNQKEDPETAGTTLRIITSRNEDILSAAIRLRDGGLVAATANHARYWKNAPAEQQSTPAFVRIPIFEDDHQWGTVEMAFQPLYRGGLAGLWEHTFLKLSVFVVLSGFFLFSFFLKRTLRHLNPSAVVPPRVKAALDTLAEGVVLMNDKELIVHANAAFLNKTGKTIEDLLGQKTSGLGWMKPKSKKLARNLPWLATLNDGEERKGIRLGLTTDNVHHYTFVVSCVPIMDDKKRCRGALATFNDVTKVEEKNEQLKVVIEKLQLSREEIQKKNKVLQVMATRDPLTKCLNRGALFRRFEDQIKGANRYCYEITCIMFDIDHFKLINDNHGHAKGDLVLKGVAGLLLSQKRATDLIGRYGGEEFCVVLPHTSMENAMRTAERYRLAIEQHDFEGLHVTASFGVSSNGYGAEKPEELIDQADQCLYNAKESGRNRVVSWQQLHPDSARRALTSSTDIVDRNRRGKQNADSKSPSPDKHSIDHDNSSSATADEAADLVASALNEISHSSVSMGRQACREENGGLIVQLNRTGVWGRKEPIDSGKPLNVEALSAASKALKQE